MFSVVEFSESAGGGLAVVHEGWFTPRKSEILQTSIGIPSSSVTCLNENSLGVCSQTQYQRDSFGGQSVGFEKKVIELLTTIKEQNTEILKKFDKKYHTEYNVCIPELPVSLPLETNDKLLLLEKYLQEHKFDDLSAYFASLGGRTDISSKTNKVLKCLLTDKLAALYNFYGKRNEKFAFGELILKKCVVHIFLVCGLSEILEVWSFKDIKAKAMVIPSENSPDQWVFFPLVHTLC